jgi:hypothetical protein
VSLLEGGRQPLPLPVRRQVEGEIVRGDTCDSSTIPISSYVKHTIHNPFGLFLGRFTKIRHWFYND